MTLLRINPPIQLLQRLFSCEKIHIHSYQEPYCFLIKWLLLVFDLSLISCLFPFQCTIQRVPHRIEAEPYRTKQRPLSLLVQALDPWLNDLGLVLLADYVHVEMILAGNSRFNGLECRLRRISRERFLNDFLGFLVGEFSNVKRMRFELRYEVAISF